MEKTYIISFVLCFCFLVFGLTTVEVVKEYNFNKTLNTQLTYDYEITLKKAECDILSDNFKLL